MKNKYARDVSHMKTIDPYRLQELYQMHPCAEHVVKKLLCAGERSGGKSLDKDIQECIDTLTRWQEMRTEDGARVGWPEWATHSLRPYEGGPKLFVKQRDDGSEYFAHLGESGEVIHLFTPNNYDHTSLEARP